jgi:hypothetical protein
MGLIYSNAFLVISATASANSYEGLSRKRGIDGRPHAVMTAKLPDHTGKEHPIHIRLAIDHEIITSCRTKTHRHWEKTISVTYPLLSRAWGFQERLLATRVLHFTPSELVWECQGARWCECGAIKRDSTKYPSRNNFSAAFNECLKAKPKPTPAMIRQIWREIVKSYSRRRLTVGEDKLPALSGVARLLGKATGDQYVAGLWRRALPFDLLWRCDQSMPLGSTKCRKPSWSWTSVDSGINWPVCREPESSQMLPYISSETNFEENAKGVKVLGVSCQSRGKNPFGSLESGEIKLKGRIMYGIEGIPKVFNWDGMYDTSWSIRVSGGTETPFWPDIDLSQTPPGNKHHEVYNYVQIMSTRNELCSWEEGLIVRSTRNLKNANEYERVGVTTNVSRKGNGWWKTLVAWFKGIIKRDITLI